MKIKTSELTGAALDWAVARCEDHTNILCHKGSVFVNGEPGSCHIGMEYAPSSEWVQGGPIIERDEYLDPTF